MLKHAHKSDTIKFVQKLSKNVLIAVRKPNYRQTSVNGKPEDLADEEWLRVFDQLDANKDEHLDPREIDLLSNDETLIFLIQQAKIDSPSSDTEKAEL